MEYFIKRGSLDASNSSGDILSFNFTLNNPTAMAVDVVADQLYWISSGNMVSRSSFDGSNLQEVYTSSDGIDSIAVFEDFLYLSSFSRNITDRIKISDTDEQKST